METTSATTTLLSYPYAEKDLSKQIPAFSLITEKQDTIVFLGWTFGYQFSPQCIKHVV